MAAYDMILDLVREYFVDLGYNYPYVAEYFSESTFSELIAIRLANANIMIRNKTDRSSHQTHIAITGEAIDFFYTPDVFLKMDNKTVEKIPLLISLDNINNLITKNVNVTNTGFLELEDGYVTIGKRTQKQVQLSKRNSQNSDNFNQLRLGLYENDLLIMLKYRDKSKVLAVGIPQIFYLDYIPNYVSKYETNTYLRLPIKRIGTK